MFEISPVLAGTFDRPDYVPATSNINRPTDDVAAATDVSEVDPRRYSQFDRTTTKVSDATMSFGDFLDMINPLQHIPVISSVYREITGDKINPVSRVAGDILYGGALGVAGALAGGIGAIADNVMETKTGKDVTGTVVASLFGDDKPNTNNDAAQPVTQIATAETASTESVSPPALVPSPLPIETVSAQAATTEAAPPTLQNLQPAKLNPLARNNLPYGGALAPLPNYHNENLKMAIANATGGLHVSNTIYSNRLNNGALAPLETPPANKVVTTGDGLPALPSTPIPNSDNLSGQQSTAIPAGLQDDAAILKALGVYRSVAEGTGNSARN